MCNSYLCLRYCSVAAFGPTSGTTMSGNQSRSIAIDADFVMATDGTGCEPPVSKSSSMVKRNTWWPSWTADPTSEPSLYEGKIVLVKRGGCLFEDKARMAEAAGALSVIVANNEVRA